MNLFGGFNINYVYLRQIKTIVVMNYAELKISNPKNVMEVNMNDGLQAKIDGMEYAASYEGGNWKFGVLESDAVKEATENWSNWKEEHLTVIDIDAFLRDYSPYAELKAKNPLAKYEIDLCSCGCGVEIGDECETTKEECTECLEMVIEDADLANNLEHFFRRKRVDLIGFLKAKESF